MYLIMKRRQPGIFVYDAIPHLIFNDRKTAREVLKKLEKSSSRFDYWIAKVKVYEA